MQKRNLIDIQGKIVLTILPISNNMWGRDVACEETIRGVRSSQNENLEVNGKLEKELESKRRVDGIDCFVNFK